MIRNSTDGCEAPGTKARFRIKKTQPMVRFAQRLSQLDAGTRRFLMRCFLVILFSASLLPVAFASGNQKKDKFRGTVVHAGPKAITVKSQENIYAVRTFNYTPELEKKIHSKPPVSGKKVTVHYFRGTDLATKVD